mmetsp:Transcript_19348/g.30267  ORF Transcript_19348/g.30267 Transcript_19348/m.30267 type:complete len:220 (+) Transcript_19348:2644-3303(+)
MTIQLNLRDNFLSFQQKGTFFIHCRFHFHTNALDFGVEFILRLEGIHANLDNITIVPIIFGHHHSPRSLTQIQHTLQLKRGTPLLLIALRFGSLLRHIRTVLLIPRHVRNLKGSIVRTNFGKYLQHLRHVDLSQLNVGQNITCIGKLFKYGAVLLPVPIGVETYRLFTVMLPYQFRGRFCLLLQHLLAMTKHFQSGIIRHILQSGSQLVRNCILVQFIQ